MSYKLKYSPAAQKDMDQVWNEVFCVSKSEEIAQKYIKDFLNVIEKKKKFPTTGTPLYHGPLFTGFYYVNFKAYKAFYRIRDTYIEVIRIISSRRDFMKILFGEL